MGAYHGRHGFETFSHRKAVRRASRRASTRRSPTRPTGGSSRRSCGGCSLGREEETSCRSIRPWSPSWPSPSWASGSASCSGAGAPRAPSARAPSRRSSPSQRTARERVLEEKRAVDDELAAARADAERYRGRVVEHFYGTSEQLRALTVQYRGRVRSPRRGRAGALPRDLPGARARASSRRRSRSGRSRGRKTSRSPRQMRMSRCWLRISGLLLAAAGVAACRETAPPTPAAVMAPAPAGRRLRRWAGRGA